MWPEGIHLVERCHAVACRLYVVAVFLEHLRGGWGDQIALRWAVRVLHTGWRQAVRVLEGVTNLEAFCKSAELFTNRSGRVTLRANRAVSSGQTRRP